MKYTVKQERILVSVPLEDWNVGDFHQTRSATEEDLAAASEGAGICAGYTVALRQLAAWKPIVRAAVEWKRVIVDLKLSSTSSDVTADLVEAIKECQMELLP